MTRLGWITKNVTCNRPNIWVRPNGSSHQLNESDSSIRRVWASNWAKFVNLHEFFFFGSIFDRPFRPKLMGLLLTKIYIFLNHVYIYIYIIWTFFHILYFKLGLQAQLVCHYTTLNLLGLQTLSVQI